MDSRLGNVLLGMGSSYHFPGGHSVYGQFVLDEFNFDALKAGNGSWLNKMAYQLGYSYEQHYGEHFFKARVEWNAARPFVYTHKDVLTNYAHFSQPIAHPLGTDFNEVLVRLRWNKKRWSALLHYSIAQRGLPQMINGVYYGDGADLWTSYDSRSRNEGFGFNDFPSVTITNIRANVAWMAQTAWKLELFGELGYRSGPVYPAVAVDGVLPSSVSSIWFSLGLRTQLYRTYSDI